jgi:hypothetical protein
MSAQSVLMSFSEQYLIEENRALMEQLAGRRVRLTDEQRRRLAARANGSVAES